jgi:DNA polymerase-3 subunit delta
LSAGTSASSILSWALRYVTQLHRARAALDTGDDSFAAMRSFVPPVHFRREATVQSALKTWTAPRLARVMEQLAETTFNARRTASLADSLAQRALLSLAVSARRKER